MHLLLKVKKGVMQEAGGGDKANQFKYRDKADQNIRKLILDNAVMIIALIRYLDLHPTWRTGHIWGNKKNLVREIR